MLKEIQEYAAENIISGSNFRLQKGYKILLCVLYMQDSDRYGMRRHHRLPRLCLCGKFIIFTIDFFLKILIYYDYNKISNISIHLVTSFKFFIFQAENIHSRTRISAFSILSGIKTISGLCGTLIARFLPIALIFQVYHN